MECIELNWLYKHMKKARSSQAVIFVLKCVKHSFPCEYRRLRNSCFPANFAKFSRAPFLQNTCGRCFSKLFLLRKYLCTGNQLDSRTHIDVTYRIYCWLWTTIRSSCSGLFCKNEKDNINIVAKFIGNHLWWSLS